MKFFDIVWKEISLVKNQRVALLLIFIYPFLVIGLIGTAFTGIDISKMKAARVGVLNELEFAPDFAKKFSSLNQLSIIEFKDENSLIDSLKNKSIVAGLRLSGETKYSQIKVELYYDNSSLLASKFFVEIAKAMMQRITADLSTQELSMVWQTISELANSIDTENQTIDDFKSQLSSAGASLDSLESDLDALDFSQIDGALSSQKGVIEDFNSQNSYFVSQVASFKSSFGKVKAMAGDLNRGISSYKSHLDNIAALAGGMDVLLSKSIDDLSSLRDSSQSQEERDVLDRDINYLASARNDLASLNKISDELSLVGNELSDSGSSLNYSISQADLLFLQLEEQSEMISSTLGSSSATISDMSSQLSVFKSSINEVKALISDSRVSKADIESKLNSSSKLLSVFSTDITAIKNIDPQVLAKPAFFYERKVFNVDPFGILVSNSAVIVLLLTCMLLTSLLILLESNQNVSQRFALSPTSKVVFLGGKICGQLVIALTEAVIILAVAFWKFDLPFSIGGISSIGFGLVSQASWIDIFIATAIISISFISLGILISFFTKNQSTAVLASLLIVVPMIFLSGVVLPTEFMEPLMQGVSSLLPLTIGNNILVGIIVKGYSLSNIALELGALAGISAVIIAVVLTGKKHLFA